MTYFNYQVDEKMTAQIEAELSPTKRREQVNIQPQVQRKHKKSEAEDILKTDTEDIVQSEAEETVKSEPEDIVKSQTQQDSQKSNQRSPAVNHRRK